MIKCPHCKTNLNDANLGRACPGCEKNIPKEAEEAAPKKKKKK